MPTIIAGQPAQFTVTIQANGAPVAIDPSSAITAQLFTIDGKQSLSPAKPAASTDAGADWPNGVIAVSFAGSETGTLEPPECMLVVASAGPSFAVKRFRVNVEAAGAPTKSDLFVKDFIVDELRADRLLMLAQGIVPGIQVSDDYLWMKVVAAEAEIKHTLRVPLVPTQFFPTQPTQEEIDALDGMPWAIDPAYDYNPDFFQGEKWGYLVTRQKPIQAIQRMRFTYPSPATTFFDVPLDWIRSDDKYGHIRLVPATSAFSAPLSAFLLQAVGGGKTIPFMVQLTYVAGIKNAQAEYPELLDAIKKMAVLKVVGDAYLPQSGSISADGLSQSMSVDMDKYHDAVDRILNGDKGANGGLMTAIHGIRTVIM